MAVEEEKPKKPKWLVYTRGTIPLHRLGPPLMAISENISRHYPVLKGILYINIGQKVWWAWDENEIKQVGKEILEKTRTEKGKKAHFKLMKECADKAINSSEEIIKTDLSNFSDKELIGLYEKLKKETYPASCFLNVDIDAVDVYPAELLKERVKKETGNDFSSVYSRITAPAYKSYVNEQEELILKTAKKLKENKGLMEQSSKKDYSGMQKELDELMKKFWWTGLGWENVKPNTREKFIEMIKECLDEHKSAEDIDNALKKIKNHVNEIREHRKELIKKYGLSKDLVYLIGLFDEYAYWHDRRKEMQMKIMYAAHTLLMETARRKNLNEDDLEWLMYEEIENLLKGKEPDNDEIGKRKKALAMIVKGGDVKISSGEEALMIKEAEIPEQEHDKEEIKGDIASPGIVQGTARVCTGAEDALKKVKKGDILICGMSLPDYVPAMKKAAAIITDEGGITCHAAIISRELKIPCITGTRIATKALKDGELIEVNADTGVIKKVKE